MKIVVRFLVLAGIGFLMGGALALFQVRHEREAVAAVSATTSTPAPAMEGVQVGGPFKLVDHKGRAVTEKSWPGKYKLVFFGFTHCPDTCPTTLQKIAVVMKEFDPKGQKLVPLFITVDPARDNPAAMAQYVGAFSPTITGLTGTPAQIKAAEDVYKVYAAPQPGAAADAYNVDHSAYIYLMSPDDKLLQTFAVEDPAEAMTGKLKQSVK